MLSCRESVQGRLHGCHVRTFLHRCLSSLCRCPHPCPHLLLLLLCRVAVQVKSYKAGGFSVFRPRHCPLSQPLREGPKKSYVWFPFSRFVARTSLFFPKRAIGLPFCPNFRLGTALICQKWREMRNTRFSLLWHSGHEQQEKHSLTRQVY